MLAHRIRDSLVSPEQTGADQVEGVGPVHLSAGRTTRCTAVAAGDQENAADLTAGAVDLALDAVGTDVGHLPTDADRLDAAAQAGQVAVSATKPARKVMEVLGPLRSGIQSGQAATSTDER